MQRISFRLAVLTLVNRLPFPIYAKMVFVGPGRSFTSVSQAINSSLPLEEDLIVQVEIPTGSYAIQETIAPSNGLNGYEVQVQGYRSIPKTVYYVDDEAAYEFNGLTLTESYVNIKGNGIEGKTTFSTTTFYAKDRLGSTRMALVSTGAVNEITGYYSYGRMNKIIVPASPTREKFTGKEFDDDLSLFYFGARFYDPELGMWMSPDAAGQYFNPYSFGGGAPIIGVDVDGNFFIIDDIIAAAVGAGVGAYTAWKMGYDLTDWQTYALIGGGAAIGVASVYTAGAASTAFGGGIAGTLAGGTAAGSVGSAANYTLQSGVGNGFQSFSGGGLWNATWKGGLSGLAGGYVAGGFAEYGIGGAVSAFGSGFAGAATGAALNGAEGWDIVTAGLVGGGVAAGSSLTKWTYQRFAEKSATNTIDFANVSKGGDDVPTSPDGYEKASSIEELIKRKFDASMAGCKCDLSSGELAATYKIRLTPFLGRPYLLTTWSDFFPGEISVFPRNGSDIGIHSHPSGHVNANFPSGPDYSTAYNQSPTAHYMYNGGGVYNRIVPTSKSNGIFIEIVY